MLQGEHSAILSTFIKLPFVLKTFVLSILEWPLKTGFTVMPMNYIKRERKRYRALDEDNLRLSHVQI